MFNSVDENLHNFERFHRFSISCVSAKFGSKMTNF